MPRELRVSYRGPLVVLLASLLLTAGMTGFLWTSERDRDRMRFENQAQRTQAAIETRMQIYLALLRATVGLMEAEGDVSAQEFGRFVEATELEERYPGILGVGFTIRVRAPDLEAVEERYRFEHRQAGFHVWPEHERPEYHSIVLLEPQNRRNRAALGYDMFTESTRRAAMERARDTAQPAASGRVTLVQEIDATKQAGFLIYVPLYDGPHATVQERRDSLRGFVYSPFRAGDLLEGLLEQPADPSVAFRLYAGSAPSATDVLYSTTVWPSGTPRNRMTTLFEVAGYPWTLEFVSLPGLEAESSAGAVPYVGLFGLVLSGLLFWFSASQARARASDERARRRAEEARTVAEAAERRVALMSEASYALGSSLEVEQALQAMADRMVPDLADWCAVDLLDGSGVLRRVATSHRDPRKADLDIEAPGHPTPADSPAGPARVVRSGQPELASTLGPATPASLDDWHRDLLERLGLGSCLCVPLLARGRCLGVLSLGTEAGGRNLVPRDVSYAQEIAERAARAVDNATLYRAALEATSRAQAALHAKAQFIAMVSHEVRTPLNGILGMTDLLGATELSPAQREFAGAIQSSSEVLLALINDILDFARLEAGKLRLDVQDFDVRATMQDVLELFGFRAEARGLALHVDVAEEVPTRVKGDPVRLYQVLINLVGNAIKFTPRGGVRVLASLDQENPGGLMLRFEVQDTGVGIDQAAQERLFEPFFQVDPSSSRRFEGTGLGLAIVQQLVTLMRGEVGLRSQLGQGSTFWFTAFFERAGGLHPSPEEAGSGDLPPDLRILVAEDNPLNRRVIVLQLERLGVRAEAVGDGRQALEALERHPYDLVLMDCQMPILDGFAATRELRAREGARARARVPVVALTANIQEGSAQACLAAGMDDFVAKPVDISRLAAVLHRWVGGATREGTGASGAHLLE